MSKTVQVNIRLTEEEVKSIDKWIEQGDFDTRTEFIRYALRKVLIVYDGDRMNLVFPEEKGKSTS